MTEINKETEEETEEQKRIRRAASLLLADAMREAHKAGMSWASIRLAAWIEEAEELAGEASLRENGSVSELTGGGCA